MATKQLDSKLWTPFIDPLYRGSKILFPDGSFIEGDPDRKETVLHRPLHMSLAPYIEGFVSPETELERLRETQEMHRKIAAFLKSAHDQERLKRVLAGISGAAADAWVMPNAQRTYLLNGTFDIDSDTWKMALFLSTSNIGTGSTTYAGVTNEVANGAGYTTGGASITLTLSGTTTVTVDISTDPTYTASGGPITGRFAGIYEVSGNLLVYSLLDNSPADVSVTDGNTLTIAANASGVFTLA